MDGLYVNVDIITIVKYVCTLGSKYSTALTAFEAAETSAVGYEPEAYMFVMLLAKPYSR